MSHQWFRTSWRSLALVGALAFACVFAGASGAVDEPNPIVVENALPGTPAGWGDGEWGGDRLEAFADVASTLPGGRVGVRVSTRPAGLAYRIEVYRLGWYGGAGARRLLCLPDPGCAGTRTGVTQPAPTSDSLGTVRASTWSETDSFVVGGDWVSGYYVIRLRLADGSAATTVPLLVRAPAGRQRVVLVQASTSTWQAYNPWGGKSLYDERSQGGRSFAVSFQRPYDKDNWEVFDHEVQLVRFLEREGYDVAYQSGMDTDADPGSFTGYRIVISSGHDEYWSKRQRDAFEAARDAGTSLMFLGANTAFWQVRYQDGGRTVVGYKDAALDPTTDTTLDTTQFRFLEPERPECRLLGVQWQDGTLNSSNWGQYATYTVADDALADPWFTGTGFTAGATVPGIVGYEWDSRLAGCAHPATRLLFRYEGGSTKETAHATRYVAPSGARVFAAGTINWNWGLDSYRNVGEPAGNADARIQQLTRNILTDLLQPAAPWNYPPIAGASASSLSPTTEQPVTLTDTSVDQDGSVVARAWDLDGDGDFDDGTGQTAIVSYATTGTKTVRVRATDDDGGVSMGSLQLVVTQGGNYASAVLSDGPAGFWRLGEASGLTASDATGTVNGTYRNGVVLGQPGAIVGDPNTAVALDGTNDTVLVPNVPALNPTGALSIETWIRPTSITTTGMTLVRKTNQYELTVTSTGRLSLGLWKGGTRTTVTTATGAIQPGTWSHVVGTWNGATAVVYVNGVNRGSVAFAAPIDVGTSALYVGSSGGAASFFPGRLDEVVVYRTSLPAARISAHYSSAGDLAAPAVSLLSPAAASTMNPTPNFGGRAGSEPGDLAQVTVNVYSGSVAGGTPVATLQAARHTGGSFSVVGTALPGGTYTARAVQSDNAGNTGNSSPVTFAVSTTLDPTLIVAGDISACDSVGDEATVPLLDRLPGVLQTTGDTVYMSGTTTEYNECYDPTWGRHLARTRAGVGDHEYLTPGAAGFFAYFGAAAGDPAKGYFSYELGTWHVVVLNGICVQIGGCHAGSVQEQWLRQDLAAHPTACTVAILDEPRFSSGRALDNWDAMQQQPLWQALYDGNAELVVSGDDHIYERFGPQRPDGTADAARGLRQFVVGTGGVWHTSLVTTWPNSLVRNNDTWGVLKLTLRSGAYDWSFVQQAGKTFTDSGTASCHGAPSDTTPPAVTLTQPANGSVGSDTTPAFQGAAGTAGGDLDTITIDIHTGTTISGSPIQTLTTTRTAGSWTATANPALTPGTYTAQARQTDNAGNTGTSNPNTFTITAPSDTTPPLVTLTQPANGSSSSSQLPTLQGAAGTAPGDLPTVTVGIYTGSSATGSPLQTLTATANAGTWSTQTTSPLSPGTYTAQARQTDNAGNTGTSNPNTFTITAAPTYATTILADAPIGYWRLGEVSGASAANQVAGGAGGTYLDQCTLGAAGALANDPDTAVDLDGTSARVSVAPYAGLETGDGPLTIELWLKRARTNREEIVLSKGADGYEITIAKNGFVEFHKSGDRRIAVSTAKISDTASWHHLVVAKSGASVAIYLDGADVTGRVTLRALSNTGLPLSIGGLGSSFFNGSVDEVAVYNTALAASRIQQHFAVAR